jgi:hypothetical protein
MMAMHNKPPPMAKFPVLVPPEMHIEFKLMCVREGRSMSEVVRELLEAKLNAARVATAKPKTKPTKSTKAEEAHI